MFSKIDVNGDGASPLYKFLKMKQGGWFGRYVLSPAAVCGDSKMVILSQRMQVELQSILSCFFFLTSSNIKWNFTKFLVDRSGMPIGRYAPTTKPTVSSGWPRAVWVALLCGWGSCSVCFALEVQLSCQQKENSLGA